MHFLFVVLPFAAFVLFIFRMPNFFAHLPKGKKFFEKGDYDIYTHRFGPIAFLGSRYHSSSKRLGFAYLKARRAALWRDLLTDRDGRGISWEIKVK